MKKLLLFALGVGTLFCFTSCSLRSSEDYKIKGETTSYESAGVFDKSAVDEYLKENRCGIVELYRTEQGEDNALFAVDLTVNDSDTIDICLTNDEISKYDYLYVKMSGNVTNHTLAPDGRIKVEDNAKFSVTYNDKRTIVFVIIKSPSK